MLFRDVDFGILLQSFVVLWMFIFDDCYNRIVEIRKKTRVYIYIGIVNVGYSKNIETEE